MSLGSPLGINITAQTGQAEQGIDRVNQKLEQTKIKAREASLATKDLNAEMSKSLREGAHLAKETGYSGVFKEASRGSGGSVLGGLAIAAAAGAALTQVISRFTDLAEESAKRIIGFQDMFRAGAAKAEQARGASAERGLGQEQAYRQALYKGGPSAIKRASQMIEEGMDPTAAYAAAADTEGVVHDATGPHSYKAVHDVLMKIHRRGGDVVAAAQKIKKRPWMMEGQSPADDLMGIPNDGYSRDFIRDYNLGADQFLSEADRARATKGKTAIADRRNAARGDALPGAQKDLSWATDPDGTAKQEVITAINKMVEDANRLAKTQGVVGKALANLLSKEGSKKVQAIRLANDADRAMDGDP